MFSSCCQTLWSLRQKTTVAPADIPQTLPRHKIRPIGHFLVTLHQQFSEDLTKKPYGALPCRTPSWCTVIGQYRASSCFSLAVGFKGPHLRFHGPKWSLAEELKKNKSEITISYMNCDWMRFVSVVELLNHGRTIPENTCAFTPLTWRQTPTPQSKWKVRLTRVTHNYLKGSRGRPRGIVAKIILQIHAVSMMGQNPAAAVTLGFLRDNSGPKWTGAALTGTCLQNVTSFFGGFIVPNEPFIFFLRGKTELSKFHLAVHNGLDVAV